MYLEIAVKCLSISTHLQKMKAKSQKRIKVLQKLYYRKAATYEIAASVPTCLVGIHFSSRNIFWKLNQTLHRHTNIH